MSLAAGSERLRLAVEAGAEITRALAGDDAPTVIARLVAEALDVWECDLYEYDPATRTLTAAAIWSRDLTPADLTWVGTSLSIDERPGYVAVIEGAGTGVSRVGDPRLDAADQEAMRCLGRAGDARRAAAVPRLRSRRLPGAHREARGPYLHRRGRRAGHPPGWPGRGGGAQRAPVPPAAGAEPLPLLAARHGARHHHQHHPGGLALARLPHGGRSAGGRGVCHLRVRPCARRHHLPRVPQHQLFAAAARRRRRLPAGRLPRATGGSWRRAGSSR